MILHYYNPTCELAIANGNHSYMPSAELRIFESDLALLPSAYAGFGDAIVVPQKPSAQFLEENYQFADKNLKFIILEDAESLKISGMSPFFKSLNPWGWSPAAHYQLRHFKEFVEPEFKQHPNFKWNDNKKYFYSRHFSRDILCNILKNGSEKYISFSECPVIIHDITDLQDLFFNKTNYVLKSPLSAAGRGVAIVGEKATKRQREWAVSALKLQGSIMFEPKLQKEIELSLQFHITEENVFFDGVSRFLTDENGTYSGSFLQPIEQTLSMEVYDFLFPDFFSKMERNIRETIFNSELSKKYQGVFGVDVLVYRNALNVLKINPVMEINLRHTMGEVVNGIRKNINLIQKQPFFRIKRFSSKDEMFDFFKQNNCIVLTDLYHARKYVAYISETKD